MYRWMKGWMIDGMFQWGCEQDEVWGWGQGLVLDWIGMGDGDWGWGC